MNGLPDEDDKLFPGLVHHLDDVVLPVLFGKKTSLSGL